MNENLGLLFFSLICMTMFLTIVYFSKKVLLNTVSFANEINAEKENAVKLINEVTDYSSVIFQLFVVDKIIILRKEKQTITEDIIDEIIEENTLSAYNLIPNALKIKFENHFSSLDDIESFLIEILSQDLRLKIGGIK